MSQDAREADQPQQDLLPSRRGVGFSASLLSRLISGQRRWWVTVGVCLLLVLMPFVVLVVEGILAEALGSGNWRPLLLPPVVIAYIWVIAPIMARQDTEVLRAFRALIPLGDEQFDDLVREASQVSRLGELAALTIGAATGLFVSRSWLEGASGFWLGSYVTVSLGLMYGLLGWVIYGAFAVTRLSAALHLQPLRIGIFDTSPFAPIGRQSLTLALVFIGGITLSVIFGFNVEEIRAIRTWLIYVPLVSVPILLFFLNMRHTHRVLARAKKRALNVVEARIRQACQTMQQRLADDPATGAIERELAALAAYEARVRSVATWPYNTAMLRTLSVGIAAPLLVRAISALLFGR